MNVMRIPIWTPTIAAAAAIVFGNLTLEALLVYHREAISNGELWRVVTGNLVHLSRPHVLRDLVPFVLAGGVLEAASRRRFALLCLASAAVIGAVLYLAHPEVLVYGGLSGVVTAAFVYLSLVGLCRQPAYRWLYITILAAAAGKIAAEMALAPPPAATPGDFVPLPEVHALGAATALLLFGYERLRSGSA